MTTITVAVHASSILITLDGPNQAGAAGQTISFFGVITNTDTTPGDQPIFLNSDSLNFTLGDATVVDNFFSTVPISLAEGESSGDIDLFDITLANPESSLSGTGTYGLIGGMDGGSGQGSDNLAQTNFSVTVTPEPGTVSLLGIGLALMSLAIRSIKFVRH